MPQLVLQFSTSQAWQSVLIRKLCHGPFSHIDIVVDQGLLGASDQGPGSPCLVGNPCGVAIRPANYQLFGIRRNAVLEVSQAVKDGVIGFALAQCGKPFDGAALDPATFFTDDIRARDWTVPGQWFCAELVACAFVEGKFWPRAPLFGFLHFAPMDILHRLDFDPRFINRDTFWDPIPGLQLDPGER